ncbi:hypothetical protein [Mycobacteroides abscessus]|uniref:hypothetical protein n=1 Tax=Mycobacteroides abscessus TaxID=36809 RepID=UPI0009A6FE46|nr:hypothetical protein [Mycobacteroides abscessus]SLC01127.1 Uncharacterised protein [Mycobacteroides abscessus subsp. abscessus]SLG09095.1 Uncharacterised protein [Mycobacteroides abscessus subsp. abscessus]
MTETIETVEIKTYELLTAAIDIAEQRCVPTVMEIITGLDLEDAIKAQVARAELGTLYALHQRAWREAVAVSGVDPRYSWIDDTAAEAALMEFFADRDARENASAVLRGAI